MAPGSAEDLRERARKGHPSLIPFELPRSTGIRPQYFTLLLGFLVLASGLHLFLLAAQWSGYWRGEMYWRADPSMLRVSLDGHELKVPAEILAGPAHRLSQLTGDLYLSELQLAVFWPSMTGKNQVPGTAAAVKAARLDKKKILRIAIRLAGPEGLRRESMNSKLESVYLKLARGPAESGPGGLTRLRLSAEEAPEQDLVFYERYQTDGFVARCELHQPLANATTQGFKDGLCGREFVWGPLAITYHFDPSLLSNWGSLERRIKTLVGSLTQ